MILNIIKAKPVLLRVGKEGRDFDDLAVWSGLARITWDTDKLGCVCGAMLE
jgi:hypothetical protein